MADFQSAETINLKHLGWKLVSCDTEESSICVVAMIVAIPAENPPISHPWILTPPEPRLGHDQRFLRFDSSIVRVGPRSTTPNWPLPWIWNWLMTSFPQRRLPSFRLWLRTRDRPKQPVNTTLGYPISSPTEHLEQTELDQSQKTYVEDDLNRKSSRLNRIQHQKCILKFSFRPGYVGTCAIWPTKEGRSLSITRWPCKVSSFPLTRKCRPMADMLSTVHHNPLCTPTTADARSTWLN